MNDQRQLLSTEEQILVPVKDALNEPVRNKSVSATNPSITESLEKLFPEQKIQDKKIQLVKGTLGTLASNYSEEELLLIYTEIQFLTESWLDDFERNIFKGLTLNEMLHEKGTG